MRFSQNTISEIQSKYDFVGGVADIIEGIIDGQGKSAFSNCWFDFEPYIRVERRDFQRHGRLRPVVLHGICMTELANPFLIWSLVHQIFYGEIQRERNAIKVCAFGAEFERTGQKNTIYIRSGFRELDRKGWKGANFSKLQQTDFGWLCSAALL